MSPSSASWLVSAGFLPLLLAPCADQADLEMWVEGKAEVGKKVHCLDPELRNWNRIIRYLHCGYKAPRLLPGIN
jgi:hypothetical protein